ncbi:hypothetical protein [Lacticaseibacillus rhamnosus]|uniref:hypothetical protein n=1 Tax=Lacticaseibacillus rhamnosus TaxID=47715 RepID=UPI00157CF809|nr:hypothetical protein [Lacticaseibacillus rhamnosus]
MDRFGLLLFRPQTADDSWQASVQANDQSGCCKGVTVKTLTGSYHFPNICD